jgi:mannose-6-phosphate isomerase-like protein (cupin superfamily)
MVERANKPWGQEVLHVNTSFFKVKTLVVNPGEALSLQYHNQKEEFWYILKGRGTISCGMYIFDALPGTTLHILPGVHHRVEATEPLEILEVSSPHSDEDIVRLEDRYGRTVND